MNNLSSGKSYIGLQPQNFSIINHLCSIIFFYQNNFSFFTNSVLFKIYWNCLLKIRMLFLDKVLDLSNDRPRLLFVLKTRLSEKISWEKKLVWVFKLSLTQAWTTVLADFDSKLNKRFGLQLNKKEDPRLDLTENVIELNSTIWKNLSTHLTLIFLCDSCKERWPIYLIKF